jgi:hypothetical protein
MQAAEATALAINSGIPRCQVEILLPEFWDPIRCVSAGLDEGVTMPVQPPLTSTAAAAAIPAAGDGLYSPPSALTQSSLPH